MHSICQIPQLSQSNLSFGLLLAVLSLKCSLNSLREISARKTLEHKHEVFLLYHFYSFYVFWLRVFVHV